MMDEERLLHITVRGITDQDTINNAYVALEEAAKKLNCVMPTTISSWRSYSSYQTTIYKQDDGTHLIETPYKTPYEHRMNTSFEKSFPLTTMNKVKSDKEFDFYISQHNIEVPATYNFNDWTFNLFPDMASPALSTNATWNVAEYNENETQPLTETAFTLLEQRKSCTNGTYTIIVSDIDTWRVIHDGSWTQVYCAASTDIKERIKELKRFRDELEDPFKDNELPALELEIAWECA